MANNPPIEAGNDRIKTIDEIAIAPEASLTLLYNSRRFIKPYIEV